MNPGHPISLLSCWLRQKTGYRLAVFLLWMIVLYTEVPFLLGGGKSIPSFAFLLMLPFAWPLLKDEIRGKHILFASALLGIALFSILVKYASIDLNASFVRFLQYAYTVFMAVTTLALVTSMPISTVRCGLHLLFWTLLVGVFLERIGVLTPLTGAFRSVYEGTGFGGEINADREEGLVGFLRPVFFTSEPSLVGLGFMAISCSLLLLSTNRLLLVSMPFLLMAMFLLLGSPTVLLAMIIWVVIVTRRLRFTFSGFLLSAGTIAIVLVIMTTAGFAAEVWLSLIDRFSGELLQEGTSLYSRMYLPYAKTIPAVIAEYPLLGVGYSNHAAIAALFGLHGDLDPVESQFTIGTNAIANFINYMGLVGFAVTILSLRWFSRQLGVRHYSVVILYWLVLGQAIGTFSPPRFWCYVCLFLGCLVLAWRAGLWTHTHEVADAAV